MSPSPPELRYSLEFNARPGEPVRIDAGVVRVTANNPGAYTFTGTNSFILGDARVAVVDPGPNDPAHLDALIGAIKGRKVDAILLTHTHKDHSGLARELQRRTKAPLVFAGPHHPSRKTGPFEPNPVGRSSDTGLSPDQTLRDGETIRLDGLGVRVVSTPGHCANHVCFALAGTPYLLSGDHVMGWSSTVIADPDGAVAPYLKSLDRLQAISQTHYLPAHGGEIRDGKRQALALKAHREKRNAEILTALGKAPMSAGELRALIYPDIHAGARLAALMTLKAHLHYLKDEGLVGVAGFGPWQKFRREED